MTTTNNIVEQVRELISTGKAKGPADAMKQLGRPYSAFAKANRRASVKLQRRFYLRKPKIHRTRNGSVAPKPKLKPADNDSIRKMVEARIAEMVEARVAEILADLK